MDILNFISWIRGGRVVTTVNPAQTLLPVGLKDNRRDDGYLAGAISVEDLVTQFTPTPTYKVFSALLTQSGGSNVVGIYNGGDYPIIIGATYTIIDNAGSGWDFTNIGAPNNDIGTSFIATGTVPNSWGIDGQMEQNLGAPVANVLENTIGNIWFTYDSVGQYFANSSGLFAINKTFFVSGFTSQTFLLSSNVDDNQIGLGAFDTLSAAFDNNVLYNTPIEIRVYN